jgi:hypothetical protein
MDDDLFYCVRNWRTTHYSKLEAFLHSHLQKYRKKNEFFQVSLELVEGGVKLYAETNGAHAFYQDVILVQSQMLSVEWLPRQSVFIIQDVKGMISTTESEMRQIILSWLVDCVDKYGLARFMSNDEMDGLLALLKKATTREKKEEEDVVDLSLEFRRLTFYC